MTNRQLKKKVLKLLKKGEFEKNLEKICRIDARKVVNPLISFFYNPDELVKWRSITAIGSVVSDLAGNDIESARVIMRRLMWSLNDESGGIGWGAPEAMGEIMAKNQQLADEYSSILLSYINESGNYLEHAILKRGVLWGLGRLAYARPQLVKPATHFLIPYMLSEDSFHRGLAVWTAGALDPKPIIPFLKDLITDNAKISIFINMHFVESTVGQLAKKASGLSIP